jgi:hypothetical protein
MPHTNSLPKPYRYLVGRVPTPGVPGLVGRSTITSVPLKNVPNTISFREKHVFCPQIQQNTKNKKIKILFSDHRTRRTARRLKPRTRTNTQWTTESVAKHIGPRKKYPKFLFSAKSKADVQGLYPSQNPPHFSAPIFLPKSAIQRSLHEALSTQNYANTHCRTLSHTLFIRPISG